MPHTLARGYSSSWNAFGLPCTDRKKCSPPYYIIYLLIFQIFFLLLPTIRSAHIFLLLIYHNFSAVSNRDAQYPGFPIGIEGFFIYYITFNLICQISQHMPSSWSPEGISICAEKQGESICYDVRGKILSRDGGAYAEPAHPIGAPRWEFRDSR